MMGLYWILKNLGFIFFGDFDICDNGWDWRWRISNMIKFLKKI
jgi:hypothetical protein